MGLKKPSDLFGIQKVSEIVESINNIPENLSDKNLEEEISSSLSSIDSAFKNIQEQIQRSTKKQLDEYKEDVLNLYGVVNNITENELPKYKKLVNTIDLRVESKISSLKKELYERLESHIVKTKQTIQELYQSETNQIKKLASDINIVERYIANHSQDIVFLREEVFEELRKNPVNLESVGNKIQEVSKSYEVLTEGLLNEPPSDNGDPLSNQNFVTLDQLKDHYRLFLNRIQEQLATLGGGGETRLKYLDDIVGIATNPSIYDGKFLKYDHTIGKFVFEAASGGGGSGEYANVAGIATYASTAGIATYASISGVSTYSSISGISTYASSSGIATYASTSGIATYAQTSGISTYASTAGIATYAETAGIATSAGTATTATNLADAANILTGTINKDRISTTNALTVLGDLYVSNNISFGGTTTQLNTEQLQIVDADIVLGIGTTFNSTDSTANHGGIAIASTEGTPLVDLNIVPGETNPTTYKKMMWFKGDTIGAGITDAWLFNYAVGIGSTRVPTGVRLAAGNVKFTEFDLSTVRNVNASGIVTASSFRPSSGFYQSANGTNGFFVFDTSGDVSFQGKIVTNFIRSNTNANPTITVSDLDLEFARNVTISGVTTSSNGFVGNLTGTATTATVAQGLTGTPNITVGIVTSTISIPTQLRTRSVAEKTTLINGNTVGLAFTTGGGNVAICTNPSADITLNVTEIPTDSSFDNHSISFSVIVTQTGTARTCTAVNLNGVSRTIRWAGGSLANALSGISTNNGFDIFTFTGINTVGSASTTANYVVLGTVNGGFN